MPHYVTHHSLCVERRVNNESYLVTENEHDFKVQNYLSRCLSSNKGSVESAKMCRLT